MEAKRVLELEPGVSGGDALAALCFADPVFRERYEGWEILGCRRSLRSAVFLLAREAIVIRAEGASRVTG